MHALARTPLSDTEYINIVDVLYFKLVRMFQSFLIKVRAAAFFSSASKAESLFVFLSLNLRTCYCARYSARARLCSKVGMFWGSEDFFLAGRHSFTGLFEAKALVLRLGLELE